MTGRLWLICSLLLAIAPAAYSDAEAIRAAILGEGSATPELDLNGDGLVDVADLVMALQDGGISIEDRFAMMNAAGDYFSSLEALPLAEKNAAMVSWLLEQSLIKDAGIETDAVWAYTLDGLPILFIDSRGLPGEAVPTATPARLNPAPAFDSLASPPTAATEIDVPQAIDEYPGWFEADQPGSTHALFIDAFDSGWPSNEITPHIQQRLIESGYELGSVSTDPSPTMSEFKAQVQDLGLFYITGHATAGRFEDTIDGSPVLGSYFAIQSPVSADQESYSALVESDVVSKRLVPAFISVSLDENDKKGHAWRWVFTDRFIKAYFSFAANSLSWIDACHSDDEGIREALLSTGASMLIDWDEKVLSDDAAKAQDHLFRRLIGSEQSAEWDSSPVRPFDFHSVWQEMGRHDLLQDGNGTNLTFLRSDMTDFALLVPAIRSVTVYPLDSTLHLFGLFGADPGDGGEVVVDGNLLTTVSWDKWAIVAELPPTAHGEVYVSKNGIFSNSIALSQYTGTGSVDIISPTNGTFATANYTLNFRGDFSPFRVKPDDEPVYWRSPEFQAYADDPELPKFLARYVEYSLLAGNTTFLGEPSEISYSYSGQLDNSGCQNTGTISGSNTLPVILQNPSPIPPDSEDGFFGVITLDLLENPGVETYRIDLIAPGSAGTYSNIDCNHDNEVIDLVDIGLSNVDIGAEYGANGNVVGGDFSSEETSVAGYTLHAELTLPTMAPEPAHDPALYPD